MRRALLYGTLLFSMLGPAWAEAGAVQVSFSVAASFPAAAGKTLPVKLRAVSLTAASGDVGRLWEGTAPGELNLDLPADVAWRLSVEAAGAWSPEVLLQAGERSPVAFRLLPTGTIAGRVTLPPGEEKPQALEVRFKSAPGKQASAVPMSTVSCPLQGDHWECQVPAAALDLRLRAEGFVPHYVWAAAVQAGRRSDLGVFALARGASLIGWVAVEGKLATGQVPAIDLSPAVMGAPQDRNTQHSFSAKPNERGFFQLTGIPAGFWIASARLSGFSPVRSAPATIRPGAEVELRDPLVLMPPTPFEVQLRPALDLYRQPWHLQILDPGPVLAPHRLEPAGEGVADLQGLFRKEGLAAGRYLLFVRDMAGSEWFQDWIDVAPGKAPLEITLDLLAVEGRIRDGKEPVNATFWFTRPEGALRIRFDSDAKGEFSGALPGEGEWWVDLELPAGGIEALPPVEVKRAPGASVAKVEIRLPNTELAVAVTDEKDQPVAGAEVIVMSVPPASKRRQAQLSTDEHGELRLHGLSPGVVHLYAHKDTAASDWVSHRLAEDAGGPAVSLVLREKVRLKGRVLAAEGPIAGARVIVFPNLESGAESWLGQGLSEADGKFEVLLDRSFPGGSLGVFAPGFAARMMPLSALGPAPADLAIPVSQDGGNLRLGGRNLDKDRLSTGRVLHNGAQLPLFTFLREGRAVREGDGGLTLSLLEPGEYAFCAAPERAPGDCTRGSLVPEGDLHLEVAGASGEKGKPAASSGGRP